MNILCIGKNKHLTIGHTGPCRTLMFDQKIIKFVREMKRKKQYLNTPMRSDIVRKKWTKIMDTALLLPRRNKRAKQF